MVSETGLTRGAALIICAECVAVVMGAVAKAAQESLPLEVIVFSKSLFAFICLSPILFRHKLSDLTTDLAGWHLLRVTVGLGGMYAYFYVVAQIKLANAIVLAMTAPIAIPFVAQLLIGERMRKFAFIPILVGFAGVATMLRPDATISFAVLIGLAGGILVAVAQVSIRRLSRSEPVYRIVFYFYLGSVIVTAIPLLWSGQTPTAASQWLMLVVLGPLAVITQLLYTRGFALAPASQIGMFAYSSVPFGAFLGWLFWDEIWDPVSIFGATLIVCAGAIMLRMNSAAVVPSQ